MPCWLWGKCGGGGDGDVGGGDDNGDGDVVTWPISVIIVNAGCTNLGVMSRDVLLHIY